MKTLIVGGTGMIGSHVAAHLRERGDDVTLAARSTPEAGSYASEFPVLLGDYTDGGLTAAELEGFEAIVFAAGNDIRHLGREAAVSVRTLARLEQQMRESGYLSRRPDGNLRLSPAAVRKVSLLPAASIRTS